MKLHRELYKNINRKINRNRLLLMYQQVIQKVAEQIEKKNDRYYYQIYTSNHVRRAQ